MRDLSRTEVEEMIAQGRKLSEQVITALLDEFQEDQPQIYQAIFVEFSAAIADDSEDMSDLFVDLCCDVIWVYRKAFGRPPIIPDAEEWMTGHLSLLDAELKSLVDVFPMNKAFRAKLRDRFLKRSLGSGVQLELLQVLHDKVDRYASLKKKRQVAIGPTLSMLFVIVRLMDELYNEMNS